MTDSTNSNSAPRKRRKLSSESSRPDRSFPVTKVRSDAPEEPEVAADLPDLAGLSGHWEDSIWGPLDSRLSLDPDSDGQQYSLELLQHLRSSSAVRSLVAAPLFSACLSVATGSPHEGHEETRELEEAQAAEFRVARWSQRRLLSLAESERRAAAPGNREDPRDAEEEERDREERMKRLERLRAALAGVSFAGEKAPLLEKAASGEEVLRFSAMFQPLGVPARRVECVRKVGEAGFGESENVREANGEISEARDMKGESQKEEKEQDEEEEVEMMEWRACMEKFDGGEETDVEARQDTLVREDKGAFSMVEHWSWEEELRGITGNRQSEDLGKKHVQESVSVIDHTEEKTTELILKDVTKNHLEDDIFDDQDDFRNDDLSTSVLCKKFKLTELGHSHIIFQIHPRKFHKANSTGVEPCTPNKQLLLQLYRDPGVSEKWIREAPDLKFQEDLKSDMQPYTLVTLSSNDHTFRNAALLHGQWVHEITWTEGNIYRFNLDKPIVIDLNDPSLVFEGSTLALLDRTANGESPLANIPEASSFVTAAPSKIIGSKFNVSNDGSNKYAIGATNAAIVGRSEVQHAVFVKELDNSVFKPFLSDYDLQYFHRYPCKQLLELDQPITTRISYKSKKSLSDLENKKVVPKKESQLSARDGRIVLVEYIEQRPCLLSKFGMASEFITYYRQTSEDDDFNVPNLEDGTFRLTSFENEDESPFIGEMLPGQILCSIKNNMYTAPVFKHSINAGDFLMVYSKSKKMCYLREISQLFVAGQIQPKIEIPAPNSRAASKFIKQRVAVYIYRLLKNDNKLQISSITDAFRDQSESAIRAELKEVAEFQRGGADSGWWIKKPEWEAPRDSDLQNMLTPEDVCAYESMCAWKFYLSTIGIDSLKLSQRLTSIVQGMPPGFELSEIAKFIEEELQIACWNWTCNYIWAQEGKGFLKLVGPGNPLGRNHSFSYARASSRADPDSTTSKIAPATSLTGTDKDLRSLPNDELKSILVSFGMAPSEIDPILRWDRVDLVREKATDAVLAGIDTPYARFARSTRNTFRALQKQFRKDAQRFFHRHCEVLSSAEIPEFSDQEADSDAELDDLVRNLNQAVQGVENQTKKSKLHSSSDPSQNDQEEYAKYLQELNGRLLAAATNSQSDSTKLPHEPSRSLRRVIKKTLTLFGDDGAPQEIVTFIRDPILVENFVRDQEDGKSRFQDPDIDHRESLALLQAKAGLGREFKRAAPGTVRRGRKRMRKTGKSEDMNAASIEVPSNSGLGNSEESTANSGISESNFRVEKKKRSTITCGACGQIGHSRTNKKCPAKQASSVNNDNPISNDLD